MLKSIPLLKASLILPLASWTEGNKFFRFLFIGSAALVFIGLYSVLRIICGLVASYLPDFQPLFKKIRGYIWGFIFSITLWWFFLDLPESVLKTWQAPAVKVTWYFMLFFALIVILDILNYCFFEIYYFRIKNVRVPQIISNLIRGLYFIGIIMVILHFSLGFDVKPFLTGSAILTAIIGLALQDTLGNFFSGLALHVSRPFDLGHWIKVDNMEGTVTKIDWRSTTIKTRSEDLITVPNSVISKADVFNFSMPTKLHMPLVDVSVCYDYPPEKIKNILIRCALMTNGVSKEKPPLVFLTHYGDFSMNYRLGFYIDDYGAVNRIKSAVMEKIWYEFQRNDIKIPYPIRDVYIKETKPIIEEEEMIKILSRIDFLQDLNDKEIKDLASRVKLLKYAPGEEIIRQGEEGDSFYIIKSGKVQVSVQNEQGETFLDKELQTGNFFGEISVLTGEPRSATVRAISEVDILMLNTDDFNHLLKINPNIAEKISNKIAMRQKVTFEKLELSKQVSSEKEAMENAQKQVESLSQQILAKIKAFFAM